MAVKITHTFNWHDPLCAGRYNFGRNGYLSMDGSRGEIRCSRKLTPPIDSGSAVIELCFRVVIGHSYEVRLNDREGSAVIVCRLDPDGRINFASREGDWHTARQYLTYAYGIPVIDPEPQGDLHIRESDEMTFRFSAFNLDDTGDRGFQFTVNGDAPETVEATRRPGDAIASLEIRTVGATPGTVFRLKRFRQLAGEAVAQEDLFPAAWKPVAPPEEGYAYDHISEIRLYPKDYRWLQTVTQYGWVKLHFPRMAAGELGYTLMTPDIGREAALLLEESHSTVEQGCRAHTGIVRNKFFYAGPEKRNSEIAGRDYFQDRLFYIEDRLPEANREYRFTVAWNPDGYRISVDGTPLALNGREKFPFEMTNKPYSGIDTLTLHPGTYGTRLSLPQKIAGREAPTTLPEPHIAYWGDFEIEER